MKWNKRLCSWLLVVAILCSLAVGAGAADTAPKYAKNDIVVLYTNDVHCAMDGTLNYASLAAYKKEVSAVTENVALVDAGDFIQGGHMGTLSEGKYPAQIAKQLGYDFMIPGNHEFDYGMARLLELSEAYGAPYYSCNLRDLQTSKNVFPSYKLLSFGETDVAFVGVSTPETLTKSNPVTFQDSKGGYRYSFGESGNTLYENVQTAVTEARTAGADYVVAVTHLGIEGSTPKWTSEAVVANTTGIDAVLDGHSHETIPSRTVPNKEGKKVLLSSTGTKLGAFGQLVISPDGTMATGLVTAYDKQDADTATFVKGISTQYESLVNQKIATTVALTCNDAAGKFAVRHQETNLGDLCADAYRVEMGADVGVVNGGSIRASIDAGDLTYGDVLSVFPFGNMASVAEVTGQEILDLLEMAGRSAPVDSGAFMHVSGMTYELHTNITSSVKTDEKGNFVSVDGPRRVQNVTIGGKPLDLNKTYTLASHNYMLKQGGDGLNMFKDNRFVKDSILLDSQLLIDYVQNTLGGVVGGVYTNPSGQGRVRVLMTRYADVTILCENAADVAWCDQQGIMSGVTATTFQPERTATWAEVATVLYRLGGSPQVPSDNVNWYDEAMAWAVGQGITDGKNPTAPVTQAQWETVVARWLEAQGKSITWDNVNAAPSDGVTRCQIADACVEVKASLDKAA